MVPPSKRLVPFSRILREELSEEDFRFGRSSTGLKTRGEREKRRFYKSKDSKKQVR